MATVENHGSKNMRQVFDQKIPVSVGILTLNAERFLSDALKSVAQFDDVYICDGNSTDGTRDIARAHGVRVERQFDTQEVNRSVTNFGEIFNRTMSFAKHEWYLRIDVDERITPKLAEEIREIATNPNPQPRVYKIPRLYVWRDKVIKDSITYPNNQVRFFHRDAVKGFEKITHERLVPKDREVVAVTKHPMLVHLLDEYFTEARIMRALEWDRLQYEKYLTFGTWLHGLAHTIYVMLLFGVRFLRVHLLSHGHKLPFAYDWWRYRYMARANLLATRILLKKLWSTQHA